MICCARPTTVEVGGGRSPEIPTRRLMLTLTPSMINVPDEGAMSEASSGRREERAVVGGGCVVAGRVKRINVHAWHVASYLRSSRHGTTSELAPRYPS